MNALMRNRASAAIKRGWRFILFTSLFHRVVCSASPLLAESAQPRIDEKQAAFFKDYCVECHNADKQKGKLRLDNISFSLDSVESAERWQKILNQINSGEMPPEEAKQPEAGAKTDFLEALSQVLVTARRTLGDSGGKIVLRRLNRREYKNTLRDLLGVELAVGELPSDDGAGAFDTVGSSLFMSSDQLEQYLTLGRRALDDAFAVESARGKPFKIHTELEKVADIQLHGAVKFLTKKVEPYDAWTAAVDAVGAKLDNAAKVAEIRARDEVVNDPRRFYRHWAELKDGPSPAAFGFKDAAEGEGVKNQFEDESANVTQYFQLPHADTGSYLFVFIVRPQESCVAPKDWPPGKYKLRVRMAALEDTPAERHFIEVGHPTQPGAFDIISSHHVTGSIAEPQTLEIPVTLTSTGSRTFAIREKRLNSREHEVALAVLYRKKHKTWYPPAMWIDWMELEGPERAQSMGAELFTRKSPELSERAQAKQMIERFAIKAFRGTQPDVVFIESLAAVFDNHRAAGKPFESALKESLSVVLASPSFLYLSEPSQRGKPRSLTDAELATRLSYFLWSAPPDAELLGAVKEGKLGSPDFLAEQVERMIASPKSNEFVTGFVHQWLGLDRLDFFRFNAQKFPDFDDSVKMAARHEVYETFGHLMRGNGSLTQLLKSDYALLNGLLAQFYGIEGVRGDDFRPVALPPGSPRGGLLGMSAVLAMGGNGDRTSPVERGAWVLRKILHEAPPPAPPNIPQLSRLSEKPLTPRERLHAHQEEPQCASCHRRIDPIGFGLENFDAIGHWRETEVYLKQPGGRKAWPIEPAGAFYKGPSFEDYFQLRDLVASKEEPFAQGFTEALIEYALGRAYGFADEPLAKEVVNRSRAKKFAMREFIQALVASRAFHTK